MATENQHWVPQFLIKQFKDSDGRVYRFDVQTDKLTKPPPKRAAASAGFNEFEIDGKSISFEAHLEKFETRAAPILKRFIEDRSLAGLTNHERSRVADFIAAQSFRTAAFRKGLEETHPPGDFGSIFAQLWRSSFLVAREIADRHWALMVIDSDESFYLGDNPVVLQNTEEPTSGSNLGFDVQGVEAYMPLAPKCALYMPCRTTGDQIIKGYETAISLHSTLRSAILGGMPGGTEELQLAQRVLKNSGPLYSAFVNGTPFAAVPENVENLNYLQCSWASEAVFSNRNDFSFAKRVFEKSPQYRGVPKTSVVEFTPPNR